MRFRNLEFTEESLGKRDCGGMFKKQSISPAGGKRNSANNVGRIGGGQIVKALEWQVPISFCKQRRTLDG